MIYQATYRAMLYPKNKKNSAEELAARSWEAVDG